MAKKGTGSAAARHDRVRRQHSDELAEDYVEAIHERLETGEPPRVKDLQADFGVSHVTVIRTLQRLQEQGLVEYKRTEGVNLTRKGAAMARKAKQRHELLVRFLTALGVSQAQADADAEGAEHHLSEETYKAIREYLGKQK